MQNLSPAADIARILNDEGVGTLGTDLYDNYEPDDGTTLIMAVHDAPANEPPNPKFLREEPTVQIRVRGAKHGYVAARQKCNEIMNTLLGRPPEVIGSITYCGFFAVDDIIPLGRDENDRPLFSLNFRLIVEKSTGGHRQPL